MNTNHPHGAQSHEPTWDCFVCAAGALEDIPLS